MNRIFGMVSTAASRRYTPKAIESFFAYTDLGETEKLIVIDNDGSLTDIPHSERVEIRTNAEPRSFSQNLNATIESAKESGSAVYFLNNDLIFTAGWNTALDPVDDAIVSPVSNREFQYVRGLLRCERFLTLEQYLGNESELEVIGRHHARLRNGYQPVFSLPFFCVKIPPKIWSELGPIDESFGIGGAEDNDYCLRAYLAGYKVLYAMGSFILHFSGKSTWHGAETPEQTQLRDKTYIERFDQKWGEKIRRLSIQTDISVLADNPEMVQAFRQAEFDKVIRAYQLTAAE